MLGHNTRNENIPYILYMGREPRRCKHVTYIYTHGLGLGLFSRQRAEAAVQPRPPVKLRFRTPRTPRSPRYSPTIFFFLTGSERFHGRGLSLRLCPGLAAPYRR